ncbi:MAG: histidine phosphatase family protein [Alphaproteobacteria bacterium]|nr:histidine phosphatase family protein [Alphaproteobacteria bacterium]
MTRVALLRHAPTAWNRDKRLQGRADIEILPESREELARRRLPPPYDTWRVLSSPLSRCLETATALGLAVTSEPALVEIDWGQYQGLTIRELRKRHGTAFAANESRGLDLSPPGGESPRDVQRRVAPVLARIAREARPAVLVTHRGVIRAIYAAAVDWDMTGIPPHALDLYGTLQIFALDADGRPSVEMLNVALAHR